MRPLCAIESFFALLTVVFLANLFNKDMERARQQRDVVRVISVVKQKLAA